MTSCKDCINDKVCGEVLENTAELCEAYSSKKETANKAQTAEKCAPSAEWLKEKEIEETTLKIKAAGYDVIKEIVDEQHKMDFSQESAMDMIGGVILMEEAVMKVLI